MDPNNSIPRRHILRVLPHRGYATKLPIWLLCSVLIMLIAFWNIAYNETLTNIFSKISKGWGITLAVSVFAYIASVTLGLIMALLRISAFRVLREFATLYIELIRGIPMLVLLYYIAFVGAPGLVWLLNAITQPLQSLGLMDPINIRSISFTSRAIISLTIGYSAFIAEIFRAGIESIDDGQYEAALALGFSRSNVLYRVVLPQAIRNVLPPLGNELVAIIKDSALVSAVGVADLTLNTRLYTASTFRFFESYSILALLYLILTISLTLGVRKLESYLKSHKL